MDVDYAVLIVFRGNDSHDTVTTAGGCIGTLVAVLAGSPDPPHSSTSFVERQNLTMWMSMRHFARLTSALSKKVEDHEALVAMYVLYYDFCRVHQTLGGTPAMEAGRTDYVLVESGDDWVARFKLIHYPSISHLAFPEDQDVDCGIR